MSRRWLPRVVGQALRVAVPLSYGKIGHQVRRRGFASDALDVDMHGQCCLVTGANSGIGFATARALAERGAEVWMLCRSQERGEQARAQLIEETGNQTIQLALVDICERDSIEAFLEAHPFSKVDRLVHSAAILPDKREVNREGLERTLATNLLGPHLLTQRLMPALLASKEGRVIFLSSGGMFTQKLDLQKLWEAPEPFNGAVQYAQTKRAMSILNEMYASRCEKKSLTFHCMHPGWADTPAVRSSLPTFSRLMRPLLRDPAEGADTVIWLAIAHEPAETSGAFWFDRTRVGTHAFPWTRETTTQREQLWQACQRWLERAA